MSSETVKVMVRARPFNERETKTNAKNCVEVDTTSFQVTLNHPSDPDLGKAFGYDAVFPPNVAQQTVYEQSAFPIVECVLDGYNGTIFAYGQTGCGKTHTMMGNTAREELRGIIPRAFEHIFGKIGSSTQKDYLIRCSYIEIYNEEIHDLIGKDWNTKLELKENPDKGVFIKDVAMHVVKSVDEIERLMNTGTKNRSVGETAMNKDSSRSHSIFTIYIEASEKDEKGNDRFTAGKLNLVDLAGSERQSKTQASGDRLKEANKINLSLSALGNVISALVDGKSAHIPYRDSKLTRLLQDSLGGNTKTVMIANVSPASDSYDETLGTLRYASRAKNIKNQPKVNQDPKDALIMEYADEIKRLKMMLEGGGGAPATTAAGQHNNGKKEAPAAGGNRNEKGAAKPDNSGKLAAIESELKAREQVINDERSKREKLEAMLKEMQQNFLHGGALPANGNEKKKYEEMSSKLQKSEKEQEKAVREKQQKEEEVLLMEKKYGSLQEEVDELRKLTKKLRKKYKGSCQEVKDLEREHELNREDLLDTIRLLEKDVKINNAIIVNLLSPQELEQVRGRARWVDERNEFVIPPFIIKQKKVKFPKLPSHQAAQVMQDEWNNRDIEFTNSTQDPDEASEYGPDEDFEDFNPKSHATPMKNSKSHPKIGVHVRSNKLAGERKGLGDSYNININNYNYMTPPIHPKTINSHSVNASVNRNNSSADYYDSFSSASPVTRDKMTPGDSHHKPIYKKNPKNITLEPIINAPNTDDDSYGFPGQSSKGSMPRQKVSPLKSLAPLSGNSNSKGVKLSLPNNATLIYKDDFTDSDGVGEVNVSMNKGKMRLEPLKV